MLYPSIEATLNRDSCLDGVRAPHGGQERIDKES